MDNEQYKQVVADYFVIFPWTGYGALLKEFAEKQKAQFKQGTLSKQRVKMWNDACGTEKFLGSSSKTRPMKMVPTSEGNN